MRAREFITEVDVIDRVKDSIKTGVNNFTANAYMAAAPIVNTVGDIASIKARADYKVKCDQALEKLKQAAINLTTQQVKSGQASQKMLDRLVDVLSKVTLTVNTNIINRAHAQMVDFKISMDPWTDMDMDATTWTVAHELGHILHLHWYRTWAADKAAAPMSGEIIADTIATQLCKSMGITKASAFKPDTDPDHYQRQTQPDAQSVNGVHPPLRQRFDAAKKQGFDLSMPDKQTTQQPGIPTTDQA